MVSSGRGRRDGRGADGAGDLGRAPLVVVLALLALVVCGLAMRVSHASASAPADLRTVVAGDGMHVEHAPSAAADARSDSGHDGHEGLEGLEGHDGHGSAHPGALECLALVALGGAALAVALLVARSRSALAGLVTAPAGRSLGAPSTGPPRVLARSLHELSISRT